MAMFRGTGEVLEGRRPKAFIIGVMLAVLIMGAVFAVEITVDSPANGTTPDTTPDLNITIDESSNVTYSWNGEGNISGCRGCTSYNTTYGEYANASEQNLSAVWHFNENFSTTAYDDSANGNNGTLGNATGGTQPAWTTGRFGPGLNFDGANDFVNISYNTSLDVLDGNKPFTFAIWFKLDELGSASTLFSQADGGGDGKSWLLVTGTNYAKTWLGSTLTGTSTFNQDQWYFVVLSYNGTFLEMYINGTIDTSGTIAVDDNASGEYYIGRSKTGTALFNGTIDEVMLFNRNLSSAEIQELYNGTLPDAQHNVTVYATNTTGDTNTTTTLFTVDTTSWLNVSLLYPNAENKNVVQNGTFWVNATVTCEGGVSCGVVNGTVRYNSTGEPDKVVNDSSGAKPFYVVGAQTPTCGTLGAGETCQLNWTVNATGDVGNLYVMDVNFSNATGLSNNTGNAEKNITGVTTYSQLLYDGWEKIGWPYAETPIEEALGNISDKYATVWFRNVTNPDGSSSWQWWDNKTKTGQFYTFKPGRAYYINFTEDGVNFTMSGATPESVNLTFTRPTGVTGQWWEMFAWPYDETNIYTAINSVAGDWWVIEYFRPESDDWLWAWWNPSYRFDNQFNTLEPGRGYWLKMENNATLELKPP